MSPVRSAPTSLTANDEALRARYLAEVLRVLYPESVRAGRDDPAQVEYFLVPGARKPRLLVPAGNRAVAAHAVSRLVEPPTRMKRLARNAVVAALRTGASRLVLRDRVRISAPTGAGPAADLDDPREAGDIEQYLRAVLGADYTITVQIGPARANRKPVLHLLDRAGEVTAVAKLGTADLTRRLVRAESAALTALGHARLDSLTVPTVLHSGVWRGHEVLIQSALPVWRPRVPLDNGRLLTAMREVAGCCGVMRRQLTAAGYWISLRHRLDTLTDTPETRTLHRCAHALASRYGDTAIRLGACHGDWTAWNMSSLSDTLLVWDWERFGVGVPIGFDALHHELHTTMGTRHADAEEAVDQTLRAAPVTLLPFGVSGAHTADLIAHLYLLDLAARFVEQRHVGAAGSGGAGLGVLGGWLLPALLSRLGRTGDAPA